MALKTKALGCALLLALASACGSEGASHQEPSADGPLETRMGSGGGVGLDPPKATGPWQGTFGAINLCVKSPGAAIITKVEPTETSDGEPVRVVARRVSKAAARAGETPIISAQGTPEAKFAGKDGQSMEPAVGASVSRPCSGDSHKNGFTELLVVLSSKSVDVGNFITETRIFYRVDGRDYVTTVPWVFGLCTRESVCPGIDTSPPPA